MFEFTSNPEMYTSAYNVISENNTEFLTRV